MRRPGRRTRLRDPRRELVLLRDDARDSSRSHHAAIHENLAEPPARRETLLRERRVEVVLARRALHERAALRAVGCAWVVGEACTATGGDACVRRRHGILPTKLENSALEIPRAPAPRELAPARRRDRRRTRSPLPLRPARRRRTGGPARARGEARRRTAPSLDPRSRERTSRPAGVDRSREMRLRELLAEPTGDVRPRCRSCRAR